MGINHVNQMMGIECRAVRDSQNLVRRNQPFRNGSENVPDLFSATRPDFVKLIFVKLKMPAIPIVVFHFDHESPRSSIRFVSKKDLRICDVVATLNHFTSRVFKEPSLHFGDAPWQ
jgi:hypothetical protein